jgi:hypothetical protein
MVSTGLKPVPPENNMGLISDLYNLLTDKGFWQRLGDLFRVAKDVQADMPADSSEPPKPPAPESPGSGLPDDPEADPEYWTRHGGG